MHMGKRTALLVATMGALVIGGAGGADAADSGPGHRPSRLGGGVQRNRCNTNSVDRHDRVTAESETTNETNCVNYSESGVTGTEEPLPDALRRRARHGRPVAPGPRSPTGPTASTSASRAA